MEAQKGSHHVSTRPILTDLNLRVMLCPQEDLRAQLRKMEAGASDKDKVEAPNESTWYYGHVRHVQHFFFAKASARENAQQHLSCAFPRFIWSCQDMSRCQDMLHFPAVHSLRCQDVKAIFPWAGFLWTLPSMISLQRFLGLLGIHAFANFASAGDIIKPYQDLPPWVNMAVSASYGNQTWQRKGAIINHPPIWIPWHLHKDKIRLPASEDDLKHE